MCDYSKCVSVYSECFPVLMEKERVEELQQVRLITSSPWEREEGIDLAAWSPSQNLTPAICCSANSRPVNWDVF